MRKMEAQMINSSKIHELITYFANALLSTLQEVKITNICRVDKLNSRSSHGIF